MTDQLRIEPVDTLHEALDATMPALIDLDSDWQSRWSTANLLLEELRRRGYEMREAAGSAGAEGERLFVDEDGREMLVGRAPLVPLGLEPIDLFEWTKQALLDAGFSLPLGPDGAVMVQKLATQIEEGLAAQGVPPQGLDYDSLAYAIATEPFEATTEWGAWPNLLERLMSIHGRHGDGSRQEAAAMLRHLLARLTSEATE